MRRILSSSLTRLACAISTSALLIIGPIGCGGSDTTTGTSSTLPPEATQANKNMEDFMKNQPKK
jgi:hypothetical protein